MTTTPNYFLIALVVTVIGCKSSKAATARFQFEAVVASADISSPASLPFTINESDTIRGAFSVPMVEFTSADIQGIEITVDFQQSTLAVQDAYGRMRSNFYIGDTGGPPVFGPFDLIALGCYSAGLNDAVTCIHGEVPGSNQIEWRPTLLFQDDVLQEGAALSDVGTWQAFPMGWLSIEFATGDEVVVGSLAAQVTSVSAVPEPSAMFLMAAAVVAAASSRCRQFRKERSL